MANKFVEKLNSISLNDKGVFVVPVESGDEVRQTFAYVKDNNIEKYITIFRGSVKYGVDARTGNYHKCSEDYCINPFYTPKKNELVEELKEEIPDVVEDAPAPETTTNVVVVEEKEKEENVIVEKVIEEKAVEEKPIVEEAVKDNVVEEKPVVVEEDNEQRKKEIVEKVLELVKEYTKL